MTPDMSLWSTPKPQRTESFESCVFTWVTNAGAAEITANSIASLQLQQRTDGHKLIVGLLDQVSGAIISDRVDAPNVEFLLIEDLPAWKELNLDLPQAYDNYGTENFNLRCASKYVVIQHLLREEAVPVIFADGDVVYLKNPVTYFENNHELSQKAALFQNDRHAGESDVALRAQYGIGRRPQGSVVCTGFSVWRARTAHYRLAGAVMRGIHSSRDDQSSMNDLNVWQRRCVQLLRQDLFPNGSLVFAKDGPRKDVFDRHEAYLVHANWMLGIEEKVKRLKAGGYWVI